MLSELLLLYSGDDDEPWWLPLGAFCSSSSPYKACKDFLFLFDKEKKTLFIKSTIRIMRVILIKQLPMFR